MVRELVCAIIQLAVSQTLIKLASIWKNILRCSDIGIYDNFFEIGGDSLAAVRMVSAINRALHINIGVSDIFAMPTLEQLASAINAQPRTEQGLSSVVTLHDGTADPNIYFLGSALFRLAQLVGGQHSIFGIEGPRRDALKGNQTSAAPKLEQLVEPCVSTLVAHMRSSRCVLVGYSLEGLMAFEIAHQLQKRGAKVELVILLDTRAKHLHAYRAFWDKWAKKWTDRISASQFLRDFISAAIRRFTFEGPSHVLGRDNGELPWYVTDKKLLTILQRSYKPQRIESRGVFFLAEEAESPAALGWGALFGRGLEIHPLPCDHLSMLRAEQHIRRLASEIRNVFQRDFEKVT